MLAIALNSFERVINGHAFYAGPRNNQIDGSERDTKHTCQITDGPHIFKHALTIAISGAEATSLSWSPNLRLWTPACPLFYVFGHVGTNAFRVFALRSPLFLRLWPVGTNTIAYVFVQKKIHQMTRARKLAPLSSFLPYESTRAERTSEQINRRERSEANERSNRTTNEATERTIQHATQLRIKEDESPKINEH